MALKNENFNCKVICTLFCITSIFINKYVNLNMKLELKLIINLSHIMKPIHIKRCENFFKREETIF